MRFSPAAVFFGNVAKNSWQQKKSRDGALPVSTLNEYGNVAENS